MKNKEKRLWNVEDLDTIDYENGTSLPLTFGVQVVEIDDLGAVVLVQVPASHELACLRVLNLCPRCVFWQDF